MTGQKWKLGALVGVATLAVLASRSPAQAPPAAAPAPVPAAVKPAATVNGEPIPMADVEAILKQVPPSPTPLTEVQRRQMRMKALTMLMDDVLMKQFLTKNGPKVDPAEVNQQIADLEASIKKSGKSLQDYYKETGQTEAQLKAEIGTMLQWSGYVKSRNIADAELKRYYDENKDFFDKVMVRVSHIVIRVLPETSEGERQAARQKLTALRQEVVAGKLDFAEAAKKHSQCPSAPNGGDLDYIVRKFMVDEMFAKVAFGLKVGEVSDVVTTEFGLHLIKAVDRKPGEASDFNKIKDEIRDAFVEEMRQQLLIQQRKAAKIEIGLP